MKVTENHDRLVRMLKESISLMCKTTLTYDSELNIEGLLGITLDKHEVLLININQSVVAEDTNQRQSERSCQQISASPVRSQNVHKQHTPVSCSTDLTEHFVSDQLQNQLPLQSQSAPVMQIIKPEESPTKSPVFSSDVASLIMDEHSMLESLSFLNEDQAFHASKYSPRKRSKRQKSDTVAVVDIDLTDVKEELCPKDASDGENSDSIVSPLNNTSTDHEEDNMDYSELAENTSVDDRVSSLSEESHSTVTEAESSASVSETTDTIANTRKSSKRKSHICQECGKGYNSRVGLDYHSKMHNNSVFTCHCGKTYSEKAILQSHMRAVHEHQVYTCSKCMKTFEHRYNLIQHDCSIDSGGKFKCDHCGKLYKKRQLLMDHLKVVLSQRKYQCEKCEQTFSSRSSFHKHSLQCDT